MRNDSMAKTALGKLTPKVMEFERVPRSVIDGFRSLDDLTESRLNMPVDMTRSGLGMWEGRDLYELHGSNHPHIHGGEIACLKGLQGSIGWAESEAFRAPRAFENFDQP